MDRRSVILYTKSTPDVIGDALRQHFEVEGPRLWRFVWLISVPLLLSAWIRGPRWNDPSRQVVRKIDGRTFRLERRHRIPLSAAFYGTWQADDTGTRIEGYFRLPPNVLILLRFWLAIMLFMSSLGVVLNALDLTIRTHYTVDPKFGLILSSVMLLISIGLYQLAMWFGSRQDSGSIAFIEQKLVAFTPEATRPRN